VVQDQSYLNKSYTSQLYVRDFNTVASPTKPPKMIRGRRAQPTSRSTAIQNSTLDLKLVKKNTVTVRSVQFVLVRFKKGNFLPHETANAIVQHVVYALVQGFLREEEDWSVVWQHPWTSTRSRIRVRRGAEDGTRDALNGRSWYACGDELRLPVDDAGYCAMTKTEVSRERERKVSAYL